MSDPQIKLDDEMTAKLKAQHEQVQNDILNLSPEARENVKAVKKTVEEELEKCNDEFFSDQMFTADAMLKKFGISGGDRDAFS